MSNKLKPYIVQALIFIILLALGAFGAWYFLSTQKTAPKRERVDTGVLVEVQSFQKADHLISLQAAGTATPSKQMALKPELSGRISTIHPAWYPGGRVKKGEVLVKISPKDYELALSNAKIALRQKEIALVLEKARAKAAENELAILAKSFEHNEMTPQETALVTREPQLQEALASIEAAKNNVTLAQRMLQRSTIYAPFDAVIEQTNVTVGDYVGAQTTLASLVATDNYWVRLSVYPSHLAWLGIPGVNATEGSFADIIYNIGEKNITRQGQIHSLMGSVESLGRMLQILIRVDDPLGEPSQYPLLLNSFVSVQLKANKPIQAIALPRALVREGDKVFVCNSENRLEIRNVQIIYKGDSVSYVTNGIESGEKIVSTLMTTPIEGQKLRIKGEDKPRDTSAKAPKSQP